jgi:hypothetical protein
VYELRVTLDPQQMPKTNKKGVRQNIPTGSMDRDDPAEEGQVFDAQSRGLFELLEPRHLPSN